ncbi:immunoglobulin-like domain-containing protein [Paenibacillus sp. OV219]|uniref:immunoglobulin-like domain-containing protein n=1 Tax=Paenibacillus sp. OV219 TaxID=1884377 RepID=UPI0008AF3372|nr:immunoglobulin-like domain-containing protein [Paenibacillus sp. OV219]SEM91918.1 hypothetical protein SAMN05518847_1011145 [Paenibacillus sp. OV219]
MKKWAVVMLVLSMFAFTSSIALAHGNDHKDDWNKSKLQSCNEVVASLNVTLAKVKNDWTRTVLKRMIANFKAECTQGSNTGNQNDTNIVNADKSDLALTFLGIDNANSVTLPIILPQTGKNGSSISWVSSNPNVLSNDGLSIHRSTNVDIAVNLTAVIKRNSASVSKTFRVVVKANLPQMTDVERVQKDSAALKITFGGSDTINSVTQPLIELPAKGVNGSTIKWTSMLQSVISNDGKTVVRPNNGAGDAIAVFTADIKSGNYSETKIFVLTVKAGLPDAQRVAADKAALQITFGGTDTINRVTRPVVLPSVGVNGSKITWTTSSPTILSADGKTIHRPAAGASVSYVAMTAIISSGSSTDVKVFVLTVKPQFTSAEKVAADKADLAISYKDGDSASNVTGAITLPTSGYYGSKVVWYSSNPSLLSDNGTVLYRPAYGQSDISVTLTAFISNGDSGDIKTFTVKVNHL